MATTVPAPIYTPDNTNIAYQLHWSLTLFAKQALPDERTWREALTSVLEQDGIRVLEMRAEKSNMPQLFVSSRPPLAPAEIIRFVKGRWQYILRGSIPQLWQRNYAIVSLGDASNNELQAYVGSQSDHHGLFDPRCLEILSAASFHDPSVDLASLRTSSHGKFAHSLHFVFKNIKDLADIRPNSLGRTRDKLIAVCPKKGWLLSRVNFADNHLHALLGCDVTIAPRDVGLSLMNNLAYAHEMTAIFKSSFYVGTFGPYNHQAIRNRL